jgi:hypothetical protein
MENLTYFPFMLLRLLVGLLWRESGGGNRSCSYNIKINHAYVVGLCWLIKLGMACLEVNVLWEITPCSLVVTFQRIVFF